MKLLALTFGTEGDTRPLAMLCRALMDAGHEAMLLADGATMGVPRALGVPHAALAGDMQAEIGTLIGGGAGSGARAAAAGLARIVGAHTESWMRQALEAAVGGDAVLAFGLPAFVGYAVAERLGQTLIGTGFIPITPTRDFPSPFMAGSRLPRFLNRASHWLVNELVWRSFRRATDDARKNVLGLGPHRGGWTGHPMLYGISPNLLPRPSDWPANATMSGQWIAPLPDWTPPPELAVFLQGGEAPVYIGFGSMTGFDREAVLKAMIAAGEGRRVLLYPGWAGLPEMALPPSVFVLGDTPHDWLFPRCAFIVHHGGSGTSHSAARAGVPSVVLPFGGDQAFWAGQLRRRGVAPAPLSAKRLEAARVRAAFAFAGEAETRRRAAELGAAMRSENGLATAVAAIEALVAV